MVKFFSFTTIKIAAAIVSTTILLGACSTPRSIYKDESFSTKGPFEHHFDTTPDITFAAMKNVILRQGYTLEKQSDSEYAFVASKQRQKDKVNAVLTISAVASNDGDNSTNGWMAVQEADFVVNETKNTSNVSLLFLSVPIPTGSTKSVNKERGETVMDPKFYANLFDAVDKEIPYSRKEIAAEQLESQNRLRTQAEDKLRAETQARAVIDKETADRVKAETTNVNKTNIPVDNSANTQTPKDQTVPPIIEIK